jgi:uncharacterized membrane protein
MAGSNGDNAQPRPPDGQGDAATSAHVLDGIRSLHERLDELERLIAQRAGDQAALVTRAVETCTHPGEWLHVHTGNGHEMPAWKRPTAGEARWQVAAATAIAIALQIAVPQRLDLVRPTWILPATQGLLLVALVMANPRRINRQSQALRLLSLTLAALLSVANGWSVARLVIGLVNGTEGKTAGPLLATGGAIWLTNVIAFALWYWEFDRGGPVARALAIRRYPDFMFVQMTNPDMAPPDWEPAFPDYLYLAFTNAAAFSPTDVMPLSRWAKLAMTVQSIISIITVALIVARAVNILV